MDILRGCHFLLELTYILLARDNSMKQLFHSPVHEVDPYLAIVHHFNSIGKSRAKGIYVDFGLCLTMCSIYSTVYQCQQSSCANRSLSSYYLKKMMVRPDPPHRAELEFVQ